MPSRRAVLTALAALGGCVGSPTESSTIETPTNRPRGSASPTETTTSPTADEVRTPESWADDCDAVEHDWVDPVRDDVEPKSLPSPPSEPTQSSVAAFAKRYEAVYLHNRILEPYTESLGVTVWKPSATAVEGGWVAYVRSIYYHNVQATSTSTVSSPTVVHGDGPEQWVGYFLTDRRLVRRPGKYDVKYDPRRGGTTVECYDG